jgi:coiled-coil-helix-coiled-coil-helix domain-containing protein 2
MPQPKPQQTMPVQQQSGGMMGGLGQTLMTGMAFGAGSEIAHQAIRGVMGGSGHGGNVQQVPQDNVPQQQQQSQQQSQPQESPCLKYNQKFVNCLKENGNDISDCQNFFNDFKSCEKGLI